ncbi:beta-propeller domain-containing protein [Candidatus Pacearchaeota archaeon]|nr:beta-propeller domain-containing protein [Candidatus Pacearchaeota archaeon]
MDDKFILMGIDDENSKDIAEILKSKTAKRILDFLSEVKEASEKDIADNLQMPLNTIEYNLKKLVNSGLVESRNFFWSVKGKKIPMYKLAKKHIIIGTKKPSLSSLKMILPIILTIIGLIALIGFVLFNQSLSNKYESDSIKKFNSIAEIKTFLEENNDQESGNVFSRGAISEAGLESAPSVASDLAKASSYSQTNIQVEGVDEADIVKNDGTYIYAVSNNKIFIIKAYPAETMDIVSVINLSNEQVSQIYLNENKLIVFSDNYNYGCKGDVCIAQVAGARAGESDVGDTGSGESLVTRVQEAVIASSDIASAKMIAPIPSSSETRLYIYDITNRNVPSLEKEISFEGNYVDSRMIDDHVYAITNKYASINNPEPPIYILDGREISIAANDVYYFDYRDYNYVFTTVSSVNVNNGEFNHKTYLTGGSRTIYVSLDNVYLTYEKIQNVENYLDKYVDGIIDLVPELDEKILEIKNSDKNDYEKLSEIKMIIYEYSFSLRGEEKEQFDKRLKEFHEDFEIKISKDYEKTVIHKIGIDNGEIEYKEVGEVPGRVLNQFSMDEYKGYFRIATTTGDSWRETSLNHLYILDDNLNIIGSVEDLAKGERIYSARFIGDKVYMVTFRQVDPLYVIDVSNPAKPEVLGYLKITGYSSYLQPYDGNHLIGIGMEADESGRVQGLKVSLFDVSNFNNPREVSTFDLNKDLGIKAWSHSEALYDHKAVLFDKDKNLFVIPVSYNVYINDFNEFWQGVYVFSINENEIKPKGRIAHFEKEEDYWKGNIRRSLYIDENLYTVSLMKIKANSLENLEYISETILE